MPTHLHRILAALSAPLLLAGCVTASSSSADRSYGELNGVLAANAPVLFVPVGTDDRGCTQYTKKPLRDGIMVDTGIWYRTADGRFVMDASRCMPDRLPTDAVD